MNQRKMQLTDQMKAEMDSISEYTDEMNSMLLLLRKDIYKRGLTPKSRNYIAENTKLLSSHKVKLENFLCETDLKERDHDNSL